MIIFLGNCFGAFFFFGSGESEKKTRNLVREQMEDNLEACEWAGGKTRSLRGDLSSWTGKVVARDAHSKFKYSEHYFEFKVIFQEFVRD